MKTKYRCTLVKKKKKVLKFLKTKNEFSIKFLS